MTDKRFEVQPIFSKVSGDMIRTDIQDNGVTIDNTYRIVDLLNEQHERIQALEANCQHYKTELAGHQIHIAKLEVKIQTLEAIETRLKEEIAKHDNAITELKRLAKKNSVFADVFLETSDEHEIMRTTLQQILEGENAHVT